MQSKLLKIYRFSRHIFCGRPSRANSTLVFDFLLELSQTGYFCSGLGLCQF